MPRYPIKAPMLCPYCEEGLIVAEDGTKIGNFRLEQRVSYLSAYQDSEDVTRELFLQQTVIVCAHCEGIVDILKQAN